MTLYQKFKKLKHDFSAIGLERSDTDVRHFCTPKGAEIVGWAGVDGIHYCFVRGLGETVFAVSPMNTPGRNVFPIARSFEDLLRLLLACGDMAALEQAHQWDGEQFDEFVAELPPWPKRDAALAVLRDELGIAPMERPFDYLRRLQDSYNYAQIPFSDEYYEVFNPASLDGPPAEWRVTMEGDFRAERGRAGKEIAIGKRFDWGDERWHVPAVYLCGGGLVADFCVAVEPERMDIRFRPELTLNGEILRNKRGRGTAWIPAGILGGDGREEWEAKWVLEHYGLDTAQTWVIRRCTFPWEGRREVELRSLILRLERDRTDLPAARFQTPEVGGSVTLTHPLTGAEHILTVREIEPQELDADLFQDEAYEFPRHLVVMTYILQPELPSGTLMLQDCSGGDSPRQKGPDPHGRVAMSVGAVAAIGGRDGPTRAYYVGNDPAKPHAVCSSLRLRPVAEPVEWRAVFREKLLPDLEVELI